MKEDVSIIILNWNNEKDTSECLDSLSKIDYPNYRIILVDNGSTDGSPDNLKEKFPYVELIRNSENLGFSRGNNIGIRQAGDSDFILILNNDTTVAPNFLSLLVECLRKNEKAVLAAPQVLDYYTKKFWQRPIPWRLNVFTYIIWATQLYRFFSRFISLPADCLSKIYAAPGCCLLIRKQAFETIDCFDENTFLGWEEFILAEKFLQNGGLSYFVPKSRIYHKVGRNTVKIGALKKIRAFSLSEAYFQKKILHLGFFSCHFLRYVRILIYSFILLYSRRWLDFLGFIKMFFTGKLWEVKP